MYNRAKHHPSMKKDPNGTTANTADIRSAMAIFREWLDETYPAAQKGLRAGGFKPLLSKKIIQKYLPRIQDSKDVSSTAKQFAEMYSSLPKGKKLGNTLVDDSKPMEADWEVKRYTELNELVKDEKSGWEKGGELWDESGSKVISEEHLKLIAWAWSPVDERNLP